MTAEVRDMPARIGAADFARMKCALQEIACGRKRASGGSNQRMSREEVRDRARVVCDFFRWPYDFDHVQKLFDGQK